MNIRIDDINRIESVLGITLYDNQKEYILNDDDSVLTDRGQGKTLAHMIKLALSDGEPIDMDRFSNYTDVSYPNGDYTGLYKRGFINIRNKFEEAGLVVRKIKKVL